MTVWLRVATLFGAEEIEESSAEDCWGKNKHTNSKSLTLWTESVTTFLPKCDLCAKHSLCIFRVPRHQHVTATAASATQGIKPTHPLCQHPLC